MDGKKTAYWKPAERIVLNMNGLRLGLILLAIAISLTPNRFWERMGQELISASIWSKEWCIGTYLRSSGLKDDGQRVSIGPPKRFYGFEEPLMRFGYTPNSDTKASPVVRVWRQIPRSAALTYLALELVQRWPRD